MSIPAAIAGDFTADSLVTQHAEPKGVRSQVGNRRLLEGDPDLQLDLQDYLDEFCGVRTVWMPNGDRVDVANNGMLGEIVQSIPVVVYDLPELMELCSTAFVDEAGHMFFAAPFFKRLRDDQARGKDALSFVLRHEAEHLRRLHLQRMLDYPHLVANIAQDIRINIDSVKCFVYDQLHEARVAKGLSENEINAPYSESEFDPALRAYFSTHMGGSVANGCAMNYAEFKKYEKLSEEQIAAIIFKEYQESAANRKPDISFPDLCEGVAQDIDAMSQWASARTASKAPGFSAVMLPAAYAALIGDIRLIGARGGDVADAQIQSAADRLSSLTTSDEATERQQQHASLQSNAKPGMVVPSVQTADATINVMAPMERLFTLIKALRMFLQAQASANQGASQGPSQKLTGVKRKQPPSQGTPAPSDGAGNEAGDEGAGQDGKPGQGAKSGKGDAPGAGQSGGADPTTQRGGGSPAANVNGRPGEASGGAAGLDPHIISSAAVADALRRGGALNALDKLGYGDEHSIADETITAKNAVTAAINKATEDMMKVGGQRYPGGHMVNYANQQLNEFYVPVIKWKLATLKMMQGPGDALEEDLEEPWMPYYMDADDLGLAAGEDPPYLGSLVPRDRERGLILAPVDTSGSVDDAMLKRLITELLNLAKDAQSVNGNAPEVLILPIDTVLRGEPMLVTADNVEQFLREGLSIGGRGGTSLAYGLRDTMAIVHPHSGTAFAGRRVDGIIYATDLGDAPPQLEFLEECAEKCGLKQLPPIMWLTPLGCHNDHFINGVKHYSEVLTFDPKKDLVVDLDEAFDEQKSTRKRLSPRM